MKRKHRPVIPKFGRDPAPKSVRPRPDGELPSQPPVKPAAPGRVQVIKPHSTSMKSGRRGS
jgi:hypothetical protein